MTQYQRNLVRMWDSLRKHDKGIRNCISVRCEVCPLCEKCNRSNHGGALFNAEEAIEIVNSWAKEHPLVTMADKYEEVFGVKPLDSEGDYCCPYNVGFYDAKNRYACTASRCNDCAGAFWQSEYKEPKKEGE